MIDLYRVVRWLEPSVDKQILVLGGEHKILEVKKHWAASIWAMLRLVVAAGLYVWNALNPVEWAYWVVTAVLIMVMLQALWHVAGEFRDRFVITNQRIFRVNGILGTDRASIPILRILDITTKHPLMGRILNYGHFVFESAAQIQGLYEITYVRDVDYREHVLRMAIHGDEMHELVRMSGDDEEDDGT